MLTIIGWVAVVGAGYVLGDFIAGLVHAEETGRRLAEWVARRHG